MIELPASPASRDPETDLLLVLARALHRAGFPAPRLEAALAALARHLGLEGEFFSTPTSLFAALGRDGDRRTFLLRVEPAAVDLGKLAALDGLIGDLMQGRVPLADGARRVRDISEAKPPHRPALAVLCYSLASSTSALFLGGGRHEAEAAAGIGLVTGVLALAADRWRTAQRVFEPLAAMLAAFLATAAAHRMAPLSIYIATVAGLIVLLPGFTLTTALSELAQRHLSSGTSRFAGAATVFLMIGFGVAAGSRLAEGLLGAPPIDLPSAGAPWGEAVALLVAPLALVVLTRAPFSEAPWVLVAGAIGFFGGRLGTEVISPELGMFVGALGVGLASALYARLRHLPPEIVQVPGILMLVPGSIGYRSLSSLLERNVVLGVETAFKMILVATSLVAGLVAANILVPARRRWSE
jgi:uncharacterized membrane protein YjjP (DUF1212 family)